MKNKKFTFVISVLIVSISIVVICACIIVPTLKFDGKTANSENSSINRNYETNGGNSDISKPSNDNAENYIPETGSLEFFINEQTISKTKKIVGETTLFTISFKVFVSNETNSTKTVRASAFTGSYDISEFGSFYKLECDDVQNSKTLPAGESEDFDFSLTYVITDTEKFKDNQKYGLTVNYMSEEIISSFV